MIPEPVLNPFSPGYVSQLQLKDFTKSVRRPVIKQPADSTSLNTSTKLDEQSKTWRLLKARI